MNSDTPDWQSYTQLVLCVVCVFNINIQSWLCLKYFSLILTERRLLAVSHTQLKFQVFLVTVGLKLFFELINLGFASRFVIEILHICIAIEVSE